jgi:aspartate carbamoyltransferase regulatory subunit
MSDSKTGLKISPIQNGTVLDHLPAGFGPRILSRLAMHSHSVYAMAVNASSRRMSKKDIIFLEDRFLSETEKEKIGLVCPGSTLNLIQNSNVVQKTKLVIPAQTLGALRCLNPNCISRNEKIDGRFDIKRDPLRARCYYCEREFASAEWPEMLL